MLAGFTAYVFAVYGCRINLSPVMLPVRLVSWCPLLRQPSQLDCILMWRDLSRAGQGRQGHARRDGRHVVYPLRRDC